MKRKLSPYYRAMANEKREAVKKDLESLTNFLETMAPVMPVAELELWKQVHEKLVQVYGHLAKMELNWLEQQAA